MILYLYVKIWNKGCDKVSRIYKTIYKTAVDEMIIEKSRFIGSASPVNSEAEALEFIKAIKLRYGDANHNVYAYVIGLNNEVQRYNDDGEPSGTGGIPMLEVLKKEGIRNAVVVVTRYFGGIKLGAGGLVRAYTKGCKIALGAATIISKIYFQRIHLRIDYSLLGKVQNEISHSDYHIKEIQYDDAVHFFIYVKIEDFENFKKSVVEWTNGNCYVEEMEELYLSELNGKILLP